MIIVGNDNKINFSEAINIRIENTRNDDYNLVAYSLNKNNIYKKTVLGKYKMLKYAQLHLRKIYISAKNKEKICKVG